MVGAYQRSFDLPTTVLRPFNTYGPRQSARAVIPTIIEQLLAGEREIHLGRLDTRRDLTFVTDTVDGFVRAGETDASIGTTVQLGTGREVSIGQLFELLRGIVGGDAVVVEAADRLRPDASEVLLLLSDPDKAGSLLGWRPTVSLEDGLRRTVDWFAARPRMDDVRRFRV
jgi:UDP-glucose 4-epimerase